jgi:hypothetical protein
LPEKSTLNSAMTASPAGTVTVWIPRSGSLVAPSALRVELSGDCLRTAAGGNRQDHFAEDHLTEDHFTEVTVELPNSRAWLGGGACLEVGREFVQ